MKRIYFILLILFLIGNHSVFAFQPGLYYAWENLLVLFEDSTFYYEQTRGNQYKYSFGKWEIRNNKIVLNSYIKNRFQPIRLSCSGSTNNSKQTVVSIELTVIDSTKYGVNNYSADPFTNDRVSLLYDTDTQRWA